MNQRELTLQKADDIHLALSEAMYCTPFGSHEWEVYREAAALMLLRIHELALNQEDDCNV